MQPLSIAVVGSGISGLAAAWLLRERYRVTLFEADRRPGGHTHTVEVDIDGVRTPVDTGFLVFNERTYPNLIALFDRIGIASVPSDMSFSVRIEQPGSDRIGSGADDNDDSALEWAGTSMASLFAQKRNLARPRFWRMLGDILRFNRSAPRFVEPDARAPLSLGEYLERGRYSQAFCDWYLLPMAAAIWSCPMQAMRAFPAASFIRFFVNHGLLQITRRPRWMTVTGGGQSYVQRLLADLDDVRLGTAVTRVRRLADAVEITAGGSTGRFDQVVLAGHSDQSLALLADTSDAERAVLGAVRYQPNEAWLHTDQQFLPRARSAWAAWNYTGGGRPGDDAVSVTYLINRLQPLSFATPVMVTLNPHRPVAPARVIRRIEYAHPVFDAPALAAQQRLPELQGGNRTWYCGAWTGYGFHEDGLKSALAVAARLGVAAPWSTPAPVAAGAPAGPAAVADRQPARAG